MCVCVCVCGCVYSNFLILFFLLPLIRKTDGLMETLQTTVIIVDMYKLSKEKEEAGLSKAKLHFPPGTNVEDFLDNLRSNR